MWVRLNVRYVASFKWNRFVQHVASMISVIIFHYYILTFIFTSIMLINHMFFIVVMLSLVTLYLLTF